MSGGENVLQPDYNIPPGTQHKNTQDTLRQEVRDVLESLRTWDAQHNAQRLTVPLEQQEELKPVMEDYKKAVPHDMTDLDLHTMWYVHIDVWGI